MNCEVIAIGTELLLGIIVDGNSAWIGEQLALAGIDCFFQVKVGDNFKRIEACIRQGLERSDAVICCGGLGPTQDDITRDVIAHVMGVGMRRDAAIAKRIERMFASRGRVMPQNNLRQADVPIGARPMAQMPGTAPGLERTLRRAYREANRMEGEIRPACRRPSCPCSSAVHWSRRTAPPGRSSQCPSRSPPSCRLQGTRRPDPPLLPP